MAAVAVTLCCGLLLAAGSTSAFGLRVTGPLLAVLAAATVAVTILSQWDRIGVGTWLGLAELTAGLTVLGAAAMLRCHHAATLALTIAALIVAWGGAFGLLVERGARDPRFEPIQVVGRDGSGFNGFLFVRDGDTLTLIRAGRELIAAGVAALLLARVLPFSDTYNLSLAVTIADRRHDRGRDGRDPPLRLPRRTPHPRPPRGRPPAGRTRPPPAGRPRATS